jgi:hypothetical protein
VPPWFNTCRLTVARPVDKSLTNDLETCPRPREPVSDLRKLVGDTGIEPVASSVSNGWHNFNFGVVMGFTLERVGADGKAR